MTTKNWTGRGFDESEEHIADRPAIRVRQAIQVPLSARRRNRSIGQAPMQGQSALRLFQPSRMSLNGHQRSGNPAFRNPSAI